MSASSPDPAREGSTPEVRAYHTALGRFVTAFATTEVTLFYTLGAVSGLPLPLAQVAFGGSATIDNLTAKINNITDLYISKGDKREVYKIMKRDTERLFGQLGLINKARNSLLHYGIVASEGSEWISTNEHLRFDPDRINTIRISVDVLNKMLADLVRICFALNYFINMAPADLPGYEPSYLPLVNEPWRYKLEQQHPKGNKGQRRSRKRPRQP